MDMMDAISILVFMWIKNALVDCAITIILDVSKSNGHTDLVVDKGLQEQHIISQSQCWITSRFTGNLYFVGNNTCNTNFDHNNTIVISVCAGRKKGFTANVAKTEILLLIFKNIKFTASEKRRLQQNARVTIYAATTSAGLFSVTRGSAVGGATRTEHTGTTDSHQGTTGYVLSYKTYTGAIHITFGYSECKGDPVNETDRGIQYDYINTTCDCTITSKWNGILYLQSHPCKPDTRINIIHSNGTLIKTLCRSEAPSPKVYQGSVLFLNVDKSRRDVYNVQSRNYYEQTVNVTIYTDKNTMGLFSVTCGPGFGSITKSNTRLTSTTDSIITSERKHNSSPKIVRQRTSFNAFNNDNFVGLPSTPAINDASVVIDTSTYDNNFSSSKPKLPYIYVVAAGSIAAVAITIFMIICIRKINSARSTSEVDKNEDGTNNDATNGSKRPENIDGSKQQQLLNNPLFHSHQANVDCGYSTYGSENQGLTEQLPDSPLYHSYYENGDTADSKNEKTETEIFASLENNVYKDDSDESQHENVYAQVKKMKGT